MDTYKLQVIGKEMHLTKQEVTRRTESAMRAIMQDAAAQLAKKTVERGHVGTSRKLSGAWTENTRMERRDGAFVGTIEPTRTAPYAYYVIYGTSAPHTSNPGYFLIDWVKEKITGNEVEAVRIAYAIGRSFMKTARKGDDFVTPTLKERDRFYRKLLIRKLS